MRFAAIVAAALAVTATAGQPGQVSLSDPRFGVSASGPAGWTLRAASASSATLTGGSAGESITISAVPSPATPQSVLASTAPQVSGPWMCTESGTVGRCAKTLTGGVLVVTLTAGTAVAFRTLGGVNLVREVGESARGFRPAATLSTRPASPTNTGIPDCDAYIALVTRYMQCDKIPQGARDAAKQGLDQMQAGWQQLKDPSMPAEARQAAANACKQATDALRQGASAMGCPL